MLAVILDLGSGHGRELMLHILKGRNLVQAMKGTLKQRNHSNPEKVYRGNEELQQRQSPEKAILLATTLLQVWLIPSKPFTTSTWNVLLIWYKF
ncbi:unnamed protein product [Linum tenue]|uniref:Uncharacterized protein n=1 Tax=Linum tenue TaxID=586396 RepID=A0AAV0IA46_9ROSI|nr:unnamed protein product [Linum tenue]